MGIRKFQLLTALSPFPSCHSPKTHHRSVISEPSNSVRSIGATAISNDRKWMALAEFMAGESEPQVSRSGLREGRGQVDTVSL